MQVLNGSHAEISYTINTDLYPISEPKYHDLARETEDGIVELIDMLSKHTIKVGYIDGNIAVIIPERNKFLLNVTKRKFIGFIQEGKYYEDINSIEKQGKFRSLD